MIEADDAIDTGLPWIPRCPSRWSLRRLKYLVSERSEKGYPDEPLLTASQSRGVIPKADYGSRTVEAQKDLHLLKLVEPGDYVISLRSFQGGIEFAHVRGIISPAYTVLRPKSDVRRGYYEHFFKSADFINSMTLFVTGIREGQNIDYVRLSRAYMPAPPPEEQESIGRFIRHLDQRVNRLIKTKRRLIELLNEQKQAIIHRAVTRGLDPNIPLKPTGLVWIPQVPSHWEVVPNGSLMKPKKRLVGERHTELTLLSLTKQGVIVRDLSENKGKFSKDLGTSQEVKVGDIVFCLFDIPETPRTVGLSSHHGMITSAYTVMTPKDSEAGRFTEAFYIAMDNGKLLSPMYSGLRNTIAPSRFLSMRMPLPPKEERGRIVDFIEAESASIDATLAKVMAEIELIREYRTRLVADVVTGQLDVRHLELPDVGAETIADADVADETDEDPDTLEPELAEA